MSNIDSRSPTARGNRSALRSNQDGIPAFYGTAVWVTIPRVSHTAITYGEVQIAPGGVLSVAIIDPVSGDRTQLSPTCHHCGHAATSMYANRWHCLRCHVYLDGGR